MNLILKRKFLLILILKYKNELSKSIPNMVNLEDLSISIETDQGTIVLKESDIFSVDS